jgi:hypothetical protein
MKLARNQEVMCFHSDSGFLGIFSNCKVAIYEESLAS